jgi:hypothetical protein
MLYNDRCYVTYGIKSKTFAKKHHINETVHLVRLSLQRAVAKGRESFNWILVIKIKE